MMNGGDDNRYWRIKAHKKTFFGYAWRPSSAHAAMNVSDMVRSLVTISGPKKGSSRAHSSNSPCNGCCPHQNHDVPHINSYNSYLCLRYSPSSFSTCTSWCSVISTTSCTELTINFNNYKKTLTSFLRPPLNLFYTISLLFPTCNDHFTYFQ